MLEKEGIDTGVRYFLLKHGAMLPPDVAKVPVEDRYRKQVIDNPERYKALLQERKKCLNCCLLKTHCICPKLERLYSRCTDGNHRIRFWIWMHYKERYRASNTGKLLLHFFPGSEIFTHGHPSDSALLGERIRCSQSSGDTKVAVLFPSESSQSPESLLNGETSTSPLPSHHSDTSLSTNWDIIVVDGTWRQAKRMIHHIPLGVDDTVVPHIKLAPKTLSQFCCRRQTQKDRISTVEAAVLLLEELGAAETHRTCVLEGLQELNLAYCKQGHGVGYVGITSRRHRNRMPKNNHPPSEI